MTIPTPEHQCGAASGNGGRCTAPKDVDVEKLSRLRGIPDPDVRLEVGVATTGSTVYISYDGVELAVPMDTAINDLLAELTTVRTNHLGVSTQWGSLPDAT